jgi:hypothetical protein
MAKRTAKKTRRKPQASRAAKIGAKGKRPAKRKLGVLPLVLSGRIVNVSVFSDGTGEDEDGNAVPLTPAHLEAAKVLRQGATKKPARRRA